VPITALVQKWLDGTSPNYGLLLDQEIFDINNWSRSIYDSREGTNKPFLRIVYSDGSVDVEDIADAYVWEIYPYAKYGGTSTLYTGYVRPNNTTAPLEKQSLLKFDIEPRREGGCTLTPGYWKTHSIKGPAPYDDTWLQVGEDTKFFLDTKSYYEVLWTAPKGNAYYQLSFQYIAAGLNFMNGAGIPSEVQTAYNSATTLFNTYYPADIAPLKGNNPTRAQFINLAGILGDYNSGITGPGHCDDIEPL
jgi:hypothetical protein